MVSYLCGMLIAEAFYNPQAIPLAMVLLFAVSMYPLGFMLGSSCSPCCGCEGCNKDLTCVRVTISDCDVNERNGDSKCLTCDRYQGTFILFRSVQNPCIFEAQIPPCFSTDRRMSLGADHLRLTIRSTTEAFFERYGVTNIDFGVSVDILNLNCEDLTGNGSVVRGERLSNYILAHCSGSVSIQGLTTPCPQQTNNDLGDRGCCCYTDNVSQVTLTYSGWTHRGVDCPDCPGVKPLCTVFNRTLVADLVSYATNLNTPGYCENTQNRCIPTGCNAFGLTGCLFGTVCQCDSQPGYGLPPGNTIFARGYLYPPFPDDWFNDVRSPSIGVRFISQSAGFNAFGDEAVYRNGFSPDNLNAVCFLEPLSWPTSRTPAAENINRPRMCDATNATLEIVYS